MQDVADVQEVHEVAANLNMGTSYASVAKLGDEKDSKMEKSGTEVDAAADTGGIVGDCKLGARTSPCLDARSVLENGVDATAVGSGVNSGGAAGQSTADKSAPVSRSLDDTAKVGVVSPEMVTVVAGSNLGIPEGIASQASPVTESTEQAVEQSVCGVASGRTPEPPLQDSMEPVLLPIDPGALPTDSTTASGAHVTTSPNQASLEASPGGVAERIATSTRQSTPASSSRAHTPHSVDMTKIEDVSSVNWGLDMLVKVGEAWASNLLSMTTCAAYPLLLGSLH